MGTSARMQGYLKIQQQIRFLKENWKHLERTDVYNYKA